MNLLRILHMASASILFLISQSASAAVNTPAAQVSASGAGMPDKRVRQRDRPTAPAAVGARRNTDASPRSDESAKTGGYRESITGSCESAKGSSAGRAQHDCTARGSCAAAELSCPNRDARRSACSNVRKAGRPGFRQARACRRSQWKSGAAPQVLRPRACPSIPLEAGARAQGWMSCPAAALMSA
jgi:hypothetical protein